MNSKSPCPLAYTIHKFSLYAQYKVYLRKLNTMHSFIFFPPTNHYTQAIYKVLYIVLSILFNIFHLSLTNILEISSSFSAHFSKAII